MRKQLMAMGLALCLFVGTLLCAPGAWAEQQYVVYVVANMLPLYEKNDAASEVVAIVSYGESVTCTGASDGWAKVRNASGKIGYCAVKELSAVNPNNLNVSAIVNTDDAPLYHQPSTGTSVWKRLHQGDTFTAVAITRDNNWVRLKNDDYYGYIQAKYLSTSKPATSARPSTESTLKGTIYASVTALPVYIAASNSAKILGHIYYGESVTCHSVSGGWARVSNASGAAGYCKVNGLTSVNPNKLSKKIYINVEGAPIYRKPSTGAAVWARLRRNASYTAVAITPDGVWTRIQNGKYYAYIQSKHTSVEAAPTPSVSATATATPTLAPSSGAVAYVKVIITSVRESASDSARLLGVLSYGENIQLVGTSKGWARVRNSAGTEGYCPAADLTTSNPNTLKLKVYINSDNVPIYRVASAQSDVWTQLKKNANYTAVALTPDRTWLRLQNGKLYGYIQAKYASVRKVDGEPFEEKIAYVIDTALPVYESASEGAKQVGTMYLGQAISLLGVDDGWAKVRNASETAGYCKATGLSTKNPNSLNHPYYAKSKAVKLYDKPTSDAHIVATVAQNTSLMAICVSPDKLWTRILLSDDSFAYVLTSELSETRIGDEAPITDCSPIAVYITSTSVTVYSSPDASSRALGTLYFGESAVCNGLNNAWARLVNGGGSVGYCDLRALTNKNPNTYSATLYAQVESAKVYKKPSASSTVLATLPLNGQLTAVTANSDRSWYRVRAGEAYGYVEARYFATTPMKDSAQTGTIGKVIAMAKQYLGVPYVYGGKSPNGFDCSGLVYYCFKNAAGITLKRTAYNQGYDESYPKIEGIADLKAGDLLFFNTVPGDSDSCDHVGIYLGSNEFIHASSGGGRVMISALGTNDNSYYYRNYSWARRIIR